MIMIQIVAVCLIKVFMLDFLKMRKMKVYQIP